MRRVGRFLGCGAASAVLASLLTGCFSAPPQIISLEPNRGSNSVAADAPVRVTFDRPVLRSSIPGRFRVSPSIPGCDLTTAFSAPPTAPCWVHWLDAQPGFELLHEGAVFAPSARYTFTLAGGFADPQGDVNGLDHQWDISTSAAPHVASTTPADRSADVAVDAPLAVTFSAAMDAPSTAAAITLTPSVRGTRVVRNLIDHSRFVILPGELLDPGIVYSIDVGTTARGEDHQVVAAPTSVRFTSGSRLENPHAAVLAGAPGAGSTEVLLPALAPAAGGEPIAAPVLLRAPMCALSNGCGAVAAQAPLQTFVTATVAADGLHIAVVIDDTETGVARVEVIDTVHDAIVATVTQGVRPSWSPDGTQLALLAGSRVELVDARTGTVTAVSDGTALNAPPLWAGEATLVLSSASQAGSPGGVELLSRPLDARFGLPGAPPGSAVVAVSPKGGRVALAEPDGSVLVLPLGGPTGAGQRLPGRLQALGFAGEGTLVAISDSQDTSVLVRISVAGGDVTAVTLSTSSPDLQSVRVGPDGRRLAWIGVDGLGVRQAYVANADGSGEVALSRFPTGDLEAQAVAFAA